ncbi:MAG: DUF6503 family protein [Bacteroidota bacterium]
MRYLIIPFLFLVACANVKPSEANAEAEAPILEEMPREVSPLLSPVLAAHGGIATWDGFGSLSFVAQYSPERQESFLLDLISRQERIVGSAYTMGYDGVNYWQVLEGETKPKNPEFMINLQFYFFAMPFVLADEGVNISVLPNRTIAGQEYEVLKATFGDGVGVASKDQYLLMIDPASKQLTYLLYSVTYFDAGRAERYNAAHYAAWQTVNGLQVPKTMISYVWDAENETLGKERGRKEFREVSFTAERPDASIFARPAEAWEE